MSVLSSARQRWSALSKPRKLRWAISALAVVVCVVLALNYIANGDGIDPVDAERPYLAVFALIALDAVVPIFPGETTLNAAATAASQGQLDLTWIIVAGALGAIVGDSALFWLARRYSTKVEPVRQKAQANPRVREALALMDSSAPVLIFGGRYVPGMRSSSTPLWVCHRCPIGASSLGRPSAECYGAPTPRCSPTRSGRQHGSSRRAGSDPHGASPGLGQFTQFA